MSGNEIFVEINEEKYERFTELHVWRTRIRLQVSLLTNIFDRHCAYVKINIAKLELIHTNVMSQMCT